MNVWIEEMEVDFYWPRFGLVVEVDGGAGHMTRRSFYEDRRRDRALVGLGLRVMRVPWDELLGDGASLAAQLIAAHNAATASFGFGAEVQDQPRLQARRGPAQRA